MVQLHLVLVGKSSSLVWKPVCSLQFRLLGLAFHSPSFLGFLTSSCRGEETLAGCRIQGPDSPCSNQVPSGLLISSLSSFPYLKM